MSADGDRLSRIEAALDKLVEQVGQARSDIAAVQATLAAHVRQQAERTANRDRRCDDHKVRLRALEDTGADEHGGQIVALQDEVRMLREWRVKLAGMAAGVAALVATPMGAAAMAIAQAAKK